MLLAGQQTMDFATIAHAVLRQQFNVRMTEYFTDRGPGLISRGRVYVLSA